MGVQAQRAAVSAEVPAEPALFSDTLDCFVLNLAHARKRLSDFLAINRDSGLTFQRFDAVAGKFIGPDQAIALGLVKPGITHYTPGALGAALSHRMLWQKCVEIGRSIIVFEDDVIIRKDFRQALDRLLKDQAFDIVLLGYNTDSVLDVRLSGDIDLRGHFSVLYPTREQLDDFALASPPTILLRLNQAFGSSGYVLSPQGARHLLQACFPMDGRVMELPAFRSRMRAFSIDSMANSAYRTVQAFACVPPLALPFNDPATSSTRSPSPTLAVAPSR